MAEKQNQSKNKGKVVNSSDILSLLESIKTLEQIIIKEDLLGKCGNIVQYVKSQKFDVQDINSTINIINTIIKSSTQVVSELVKSVEIIGKNKLHIKDIQIIIDKSSLVLYYVKSLTNILNNIEIDKDVKMKSEYISNIISNINDIIKSLSTVWMLTPPALLGVKAAALIIKNISSSLLELLLDKKFNKNLEKSSDAFDSIYNIIQNIIKTSLYLTTMSLLMIPAMAGVLATIPIIFMIQGLTQMLSDKKFIKQIQKSTDVIISLKDIIKDIVITGLLFSTMIIIFTPATLGVLMLYGLIILLMNVVKLLSSKIFQKEITKANITILMIGALMIMMSFSLVLLVSIFTYLNTQWNYIAMGLISLSLIMLGVIGICVLLSFAKGPIVVAASVIAILGLVILMVATSIYIIVDALQKLADINVDGATDNLKLLMGGLCEALFDNFWQLMGLFLLVPGLVAMPIVIGMLLISVSMYDTLLNKVNEFDISDLEDFKINLNSIIKNLADAIPIWATAKLLLTLPGITAMMLVIGELVVAMKMMKTLNNELEDDMFSNIKTVTFGGKKRETIGNIWKIGPALDSMIEAIDSFSLVKSAAAMLKLPGILSLCLSVGSIAKTVQLVSSMKIPTGFDKNGNATGYDVLTEDHLNKFKTNIIIICSAYSDALTSPEMIEFLNTKYKHGEENMKLLGAMGNAVGGMVHGVISLTEGRIAKFSEDGKEIIGYDNIGDILNDINKQDELKRNLSNLLGIYISAVTDSAVQKAAEGGGWFSKSNIEKAEEVFKTLNESIVPAVNTIIENVAELNSNEKFNGIKADDIKTKLSTVLSGYVSAIEELDTSKLNDSKINSFERIQKIIGELHKPIDNKNIQTQKQSLDNISKFIDKANSIDTNKIKSTTDMFTQMVKMSESIKGNFDGLAEALNENLMEVLKELKDILKESNGIIENSSKSKQPQQVQQVQQIQTPIQTTQTNTNTQKEIKLEPIIKAISNIEDVLARIKSSGIPVYSNPGQKLDVRTT